MKGPTLHMNHPRKIRTHGITNYAARFIYILYVHPSLKNSHPPCLPPTAHPPCKVLSKKKLIPFAKIPKPDEDKGLGVSWPAQETDMDALKAVFEDMKAKM